MASEPSEWALREARELIDKGFERVDLHGRLSLALDAARAQGQREGREWAAGQAEEHETTWRVHHPYADRLSLGTLTDRIRRGPEAP